MQSLELDYLVEYLGDGDNDDWDDGGEGDSPAEGVCPLRIDVVAAGQWLMLGPRVDQDHLARS